MTTVIDERFLKDFKQFGRALREYDVAHLIQIGTSLKLHAAALQTNAPKQKKSEKVMLLRASTIIEDTYRRLDDRQLLPGEANLAGQEIKLLLQNLSHASSTSTENYDLERAFTQSQQDSINDRKLLKSRYGKKKSNYLKVTRHVLCHCAPSLTDADVERAGIPFMRIVQGYCLLPAQKVLIMSPRDQRAEIYFNEIQKADKQLKDLVSAPEFSANQGITYAWMLEPEQYNILFEFRELNSWTSFSVKHTEGQQLSRYQA